MSLAHAYASRSRPQRAVIARLAIGWSVFWMTAMLGAAAGLIWFPIHARLEQGGWTLLHPFALAGGAILLLMGCNTLYLLTARRGAGVWIESGEIVFLNRLMTRVPIWDVTGVTVGSYGGKIKRQGILLQGEHGEAAIPVSGLSEKPEIIATRLREILRLGPRHLEL
jgi:hypothetical protein